MDYMIRAIAANAQIRAFAATTKDLVEEARKAHNTSPVATAALGRLMTGGVMMGAMMKGEKDLLTLQVTGDGPIGGIVVTADSQGQVKGYVYNPSVLIHANEKGKLDVAGAIGQGTLQVIKDMGMKEPYQGSVAMHSGEIAEDLTYYFAASEQLPSSVGLGVLMDKNNTVRQAGGFIIQLMPFTPDDIVEKLEAKLGSMQSVTSMLDAGMTPEQILEELLGEFELEITDRLDLAFHCDCSRKKVEKALLSIGKSELKSIIDDGEPIEMNCQFCSKSYTFTVDEMKKLLKEGTV